MTEIIVLSRLQAPCLFVLTQTGPFMTREESGGGGCRGGGMDEKIERGGGALRFWPQALNNVMLP